MLYSPYLRGVLSLRHTASIFAAYWLYLYGILTYLRSRLVKFLWYTVRVFATYYLYGILPVSSRHTGYIFMAY